MENKETTIWLKEHIHEIFIYYQQF
jgi:hypothetical protein